MSLTDGVSPSAKAASANLRKLHGDLKETKSTLSEAASGFFHVIEPAETARHALEGLSAGFREVSSSLASGEMRGVISGMTESLAGLAQAADLIVPGLGQAAAAVIKMEGAIIGGAVGALQEMIEKSWEVPPRPTNRSRAPFEALGAQGPGSGGKTLAFLDDLSSKLPQSRAQLAGWAKAYEAMGVTDLGELRGQIKATASAQAIMGDEGASAYQQLAERIRVAVEEHKGLKFADKQLKTLYQSGLNVTEVAAAMGLSTQALAAQLKAGTVDAAKFGAVLQNTLITKGKGPLEVMGDELGTLKIKASENISHLFDDVDTTPLTDGLRSIVDLFGQGTASGKTLKAAMTDALNAIIKGIGRTIWQAEMFFGMLEIWALKSGLTLAKVEAVVKRIGNAFAAVGKGTLALGAGMIPGAGPVAQAALGLSSGTSAAKAIAPGHADGGLIPKQATGHADGGIIPKPAPGESFISAAPGEMILPKRLTETLMAGGGGGETTNHYHFDGLQLTIQAPQGVTDATAVSATGLSVALERLQLGSGR